MSRTRAMPALAGLFLCLCFSAGGRSAAAGPCDRLTGDKQKLAQKFFRSTYPYDCCDETLERCLAQKKVCRLATRLRDDICRRVARGEDEQKITSALERRARSMTPGGKRATFDLGGAEPAGDPKAKVVVVTYACTRCPFCSKVVPDLHRLVTAGGLKGKVILYFRPFPLSGHAGSTEGGLAFFAANKLKGFWPYVLKLYSDYDRYSTERLAEWAGAVGLSKEAFAKEMAAAATRQKLVEAKKEGLRNGVEATPAVFINGRRYRGDMDRESLLDVLDEEADRMANLEHCGP